MFDMSNHTFSGESDGRAVLVSGANYTLDLSYALLPLILLLGNKFSAVKAAQERQLMSVSHFDCQSDAIILIYIWHVF